MPDDYSANTRTTGEVKVGGSATGSVDRGRDIDWFAVELEAGRTYTFDLEGIDTGGGTLIDPLIKSLYDAAGKRIEGTKDDDGGRLLNSRVTFTASEDGTHYVAARAHGPELTGTYTLSVEDVTPPPTVEPDDDGDTSGESSEDAAGWTGQLTVGSVLGYSVYTVSGRPSGSLTPSSFELDEVTYTINYLLVGPGGLYLGLDRELPVDFTLEVGGVSLSAGDSRKLETTRTDGYQWTSPGVEWSVGDTVTVELRPVADSERPAQVDARSLAVELGDITEVSEEETAQGSVAGFSGEQQWYRFTLTEAKTVGLVLGEQDANADLHLEDADGTVLASSTLGGTVDDTLEAALEAGTYYVRVELREESTNDYVLRYAVSEPEGATQLDLDVAPTEAVQTETVEEEEETESQAQPSSLPEVRILDGQGYEEDGVVVFRVTLDAAASTAVSVQYATEDGTALAGEDYESTAGVLTFAAGQTEKTVEVQLIDDTVEDNGETFTLRLSGANGATLTDAQATGTILNNEPATSVSEGDTDLADNETTTGRVLVGESVTGTTGTSSDRDWFAMELEAGRTYRIDLVDAGEGGQYPFFDPHIHGIYDANGNLLRDTENDNKVPHSPEEFHIRDSRVDFTPDADGTYYVAAGESAFQFRAGTYRLSVEAYADDYAAARNTAGTVTVGSSTTGNIDTAEDHDWFAVTLKAGKSYRIDLEGSSTGQGSLIAPGFMGLYNSEGNHETIMWKSDSAVGRNSRVHFTADADGTYYIGTGGVRGETGTYRVSVAEIPDDYAADTSTGGVVAPGGSATGEIEVPRDQDWFAIELQAGVRYVIGLQGVAQGHGTLADPRIVGVYDSQGHQLPETTNEDSGEGRDARVALTAAADGTYFIAAEADGTRTGTYRVVVTQPPAEISVSDAQAHEHDDGDMRFRVTLSWVSQTPVTVRYETVDGTATAGRDYESKAGELTFAPGETEKWVPVPIYDDLVEDSGETFSLHLSRASGATMRDAVAVGTILNTERESTTVEVGQMTYGHIANIYEVDWYEVELEAGVVYQIEMGVVGGGWGSFDSSIAGVFDSRGNLLPNTRSDDHQQHLNSDARVFFTPQEDATYFIALKSGTPDIGLDWPEAWSTGPGVEGRYQFSIVTVPEDDYGQAPPGESQDDAPQLGSVTVGGSATGTIEITRDRDWFAVELEARKVYVVQLEGSTTDKGTLYNPWIPGIYDSEGNRLEGTTNESAPAVGAYLHSGYHAAVYFTPPAAGTYYIAAAAENYWDLNRTAGTYTGTYTLSVREFNRNDDYLADKDTSGQVTVGGSTLGNLEYPTDTDWFAVTLTAGTRYRIDMETFNRCDTTIRGVYDSDGNYIEGTTADDGRDSRLTFTPDTDGTHYIAVTAHPFNCIDNTGRYEVSVAEVLADVRVADAQATEGESAELVFQVTLDQAADEPVTVAYTTVDGTAKAHTDYAPTSGTLTFAAGETEKTVSVPVVNDEQPEHGEKLTLRLSEVSVVTFADAQAKGMLIDDDPFPSVSEGTSDLPEGDHTTGRVPVGGSATGNVGFRYDRDWFAVELEADKQYRFELKGSHTDDGTLVYPLMRGVYDSTGLRIARYADHDGSEGLNSHLVFTPSATGTYYAEASAYWGSQGSYTMEVTEEVL